MFNAKAGRRSVAEIHDTIFLCYTGHDAITVNFWDITPRVDLFKSVKLHRRVILAKPDIQYGMLKCKVTPAPGALSIFNLPSNNRVRSRMLRSPWPLPSMKASIPTPSS